MTPTVYHPVRFYLALTVPGRREHWLTTPRGHIVDGMTTTLITGANKEIGFEAARGRLRLIRHAEGPIPW